MDKAFSALAGMDNAKGFFDMLADHRKFILGRKRSKQFATRPRRSSLGKTTLVPSNWMDEYRYILDSSTRLSSSLLEEAVGLMALWLKASYSHSYFPNTSRGDGGFKCARQRQPRAVHIFQHAVGVDGCCGEWLSQ